MTKSEFKKFIKNKIIILDGGMGSCLQKMGIKTEECGAISSVVHPEKVTEIHRKYIDAGADILTLNTFGLYDFKYENCEKIAEEAFNCAKQAIKEAEKKVLLAYDLSPTGKMLKPYGDLDFEEAVEIFAKGVRRAVKYGADLLIIETMTDCLETKAAVIAAKENSDLPILVSNAYDESGKLVTGADAEAMAVMLDSLGVDAMGVNCGVGPDKMCAENVKIYRENTDKPIMAYPNAGMPKMENGEVFYELSPEKFADETEKIYEAGASILGGCCGTTPEHIKILAERFKNRAPVTAHKTGVTKISSYTHAASICRRKGSQCVKIGERINPTGKPKLKEALRCGNTEYPVAEGLRQEEAGAEILDVNVGLPEIDEREMLRKVTYELQAVCDLPLQLDSGKADALEAAMRIYAGKPLVNSINGKKESMDGILPLVKKYGGTVIALTLDEDGIPETVEKRVEIAKNILKYCRKYGICKKDVVFDPLTMPVSANVNNASVTLETVSKLHKMGCRTSLGISNVSFGLPKREIINTVFLKMAVKAGLDAAIMNPFMDVPENYDTATVVRLLRGEDENCIEYIKYTENSSEAGNSSAAAKNSDEMTLKNAIISGFRQKSADLAGLLLKSRSPMEIIDGEIIPALDECGRKFEEKKFYLPQLLMSAESATVAFDVLKKAMKRDGTGENRGKVILATVKGDVHDIGKNIVKVLLESYGFFVIDLGKDVPPETVVNTAISEGCNLVGLSALMTTTLPSMEKTVSMLHEANPDIKAVVGGAVLTPEYAKMINADKYSAEAMETVRYALDFYRKS